MAAFFSDRVATVFRLVIAIGTGPGVVLILRWFWWRINAWAELSAMVAGFVVGLLTTVVPVLTIDDFGLRLALITVLTAAVWISVMYLTPPESPKTLDRFYRLARPGGPGWKAQRERTGMAPAHSLRLSLQRTGAALLVLFGSMFSLGGLLLLRWSVAASMGAIAVLGVVLLYRMRATSRPQPDAG
jgi:hypothetical protein